MERFLAANFSTAMSAKEKPRSIFLYALMPPGVCFSDNNAAREKELRPCVVIQNDVLNESRLNTTVVVVITSKPEFGKLPGNVLIEKNVVNMPWEGLVNVNWVMSIEKSKIEEGVGPLSGKLMKKVRDGLKLIMELE